MSSSNPNGAGRKLKYLTLESAEAARKINQARAQKKFNEKKRMRRLAQNSHQIAQNSQPLTPIAQNSQPIAPIAQNSPESPLNNDIPMSPYINTNLFKVIEYLQDIENEKKLKIQLNPYTAIFELLKVQEDIYLKSI